MEDKKIRVFHTHIEISPYTLGENEKLERHLSIWIDAEYRYNPIAYYIENDVLYIPRGINIFMLEKMFDSTAFTVREPDEYKTFRGVHMTVPPRNDLQIDAINFLSCDDNYKNVSSYSQQALILGTGIGKTYSTIHAIIKLKMRALIVSHQDKIKDQWLNTIVKMTDMPNDKIINITGSDMIEKIIAGKISGYIYLVNHQTLNSYAKSYEYERLRLFFKKIQIGVKVYDEAHLAFKNILRNDMFSNTKKSFYLTASFGRSEPREDALFKRCFSSLYKYDIQQAIKNNVSVDDETGKTVDTTKQRKHIIYIPTTYRSNPSYLHLKQAMNMYGFSVLGYIKYALYQDKEETLRRKFLYIFELASSKEGKILITAPRIDDTEYIKTILEKEYPNLNKNIGTINSKNTKIQNKYVKENCDIICSTIKSCGTGVDIKGLRCIINIEPFSSNITAIQLSGRLREYAPDKDTYFFDLIDIGFPTCERQYTTKIKNLKKICKEIQPLKI